MRDALLDVLAQDKGIHFPPDMLGFYGGGDDSLRKRVMANFDLAMDAQPGLVTLSNAGIPAYLSNWIDPEMIRTVLQPMVVAQIWGEEVQKGTWTTKTATFPQIETVGYTAAYGDWNENGMTNANVDFPQLQSFHYQTFTEWGEKQLDEMGLARISWASELNLSSALILNQHQNKTYAFGVQGLQLYGTLTNPLLSAYLTPTTKAAGGTTWAVATPNEILADVQKMYGQLQTQAPGVWEMDQEFTLAIPSQLVVYLSNTNSFGLTARFMITQAFPSLKIVGIPQYALPAGNVAQLIATKVNGQRTGYAAYTEKLRAHRVIPAASSFRQKKSQGTWGVIIRYPLAIAQMIGI